MDKILLSMLIQKEIRNPLTPIVGYGGLLSKKIKEFKDFYQNKLVSTLNEGERSEFASLFQISEKCLINIDKCCRVLDSAADNLAKAAKN